MENNTSSLGPPPGGRRPVYSQHPLDPVVYNSAAADGPRPGAQPDWTYVHHNPYAVVPPLELESPSQGRQGAAASEPYPLLSPAGSGTASWLPAFVVSSHHHGLTASTATTSVAGAVPAFWTAATAPPSQHPYSSSPSHHHAYYAHSSTAHSIHSHTPPHGYSWMPAQDMSTGVPLTVVERDPTTWSALSPHGSASVMPPYDYEVKSPYHVPFSSWPFTEHDGSTAGAQPLSYGTLHHLPNVLPRTAIPPPPHSAYLLQQGSDPMSSPRKSPRRRPQTAASASAPKPEERPHPVAQRPSENAPSESSTRVMQQRMPAFNFKTPQSDLVPSVTRHSTRTSLTSYSMTAVVTSTAGSVTAGTTQRVAPHVSDPGHHSLELAPPQQLEPGGAMRQPAQPPVAPRARQHRCTVCGASFRGKVDLDRHARAHSGERPFVCDVCGKRFTQKCSLRVHSRIHTGDKPFQCPLCGASFRHQTSKQRHVSRGSCNAT